MEGGYQGRQRHATRFLTASSFGRLLQTVTDNANTVLVYMSTVIHLNSHYWKALSQLFGMSCTASSATTNWHTMKSCISTREKESLINSWKRDKSWRSSKKIGVSWSRHSCCWSWITVLRLNFCLPVSSMGTWCMMHAVETCCLVTMSDYFAKVVWHVLDNKSLVNNEDSVYYIQSSHDSASLSVRRQGTSLITEDPSKGTGQTWKAALICNILIFISYGRFAFHFNHFQGSCFWSLFCISREKEKKIRSSSSYL